MGKRRDDDDYDDEDQDDGDDEDQDDEDDDDEPMTRGEHRRAMKGLRTALNDSGALRKGGRRAPQKRRSGDSKGRGSDRDGKGSKSRSGGSGDDYGAPWWYGGGDSNADED